MPGNSDGDDEAAPEAAAALRLCPTCGEPFRPVFLRECEWCGHDFGEGRVAQALVAPDDPTGARAIVLLLVALAAFAILIGYFAWLL